MINPKIVEEIKKIKCRRNIKLEKGFRLTKLRFEARYSNAWVKKNLQETLATIEISHGGSCGLSIEQAKYFSKDLAEIISIAEKCKVILKKYKQYEEK